MGSRSLSSLSKACAQMLRGAQTESVEGAGLVGKAYPHMAAVARDDAKRCLDVEWTDGTKGKFAYAWLRDNAPSSHTYNFGGRNRARHLLMKDLDTHMNPASVKMAAEGDTVEVAWDGKGGPITSVFSAKWLQKRNIADPEFHRGRRQYLRGTDVSEHWSAAEAKEIISPGADWAQMMADPRYLRDQLVKMMTYGILHIVNAPAETGAITTLGDTIGYLLNGHHGVDPSNNSLFQVYVELDPCNLMNTPKALGLHTDFPQYENPPEVQILHVVRQAGVGGDSQFCDGIHVANLLKKERPEIYKTLTTYPIEYIDWGEFRYAYEFAAKWRVIEEDAEGNPSSIFFNNAVRSWYYEAPPEIIPQIYDALSVFNEYCYQPRNLLVHKMEKGEMMMFANNRVMHGRSAFGVDAAAEGGTRHLEGAFMSFDVLRSKIRVLNDHLREGKHVAYDTD